MSAALKEVPGDPAALKRAAKNKRKQKEAATDESGTSVRSMMTGVKIYDYAADNDDFIIIIHFSQSYQFTDLDIMNLWNSFRIDFPEGTKAIYSL